MTEADIYLWLKLDDIRDAIETVCVIIGAAGLIAVGVSWISAGIEESASIRRMASRLTVLWVVGMAALIVAWSLIPSTSQYAAVKVVPHLASSENIEAVKTDMGDLYDMGVGKLREVLTPNPAKGASDE